MKKPEYYYEQSGVIPYRIKNKKVEVLLITSRKKKRWIIPKGIIESDLSAQESAAKEALEEAGINGKVNNKLYGEFTYTKWDNTCKVKVYLMEVKKELDKWEEDFRKRKWVSLDDASKMIDNPELAKLINKVGKSLN